MITQTAEPLHNPAPLAAVCMRCGYSLVGIDSRRPCPECGLLAGFSLIESPQLRHNHPRWLMSLAAGAALVALSMLSAPGIIPGLALMLVREVQTNAAGQARIGVDWISWLGGLALALSSSLPLAIGVWLLARPSGRALEDAQTRAMRWGLCAIAVIPLGVVVAWAVRGPQVMAATWRSPQWFWSLAILLASSAALMALLFWHLRSLARRAPAPLLAADSPIVGIVLAGCLMFPWVIGAITSTNRNLYPRGTEGLAMYVLVAIWAAVGGAAYLWAIYLLVRYTLAFGRSARQAGELMRVFDASRNPAASAYDSPP